MLRSNLAVILVTGVLAAACAAPAGSPAAPAVETAIPSTVPSVPTPSPTTVDPTEAPPELSPLRIMAAPAIEDLAARLGVPAESVEVVFAAEVEWPDASVGCPAPDFAYAQVLTDGMKVTLQVGDATYDFHGRSPDDLFLCGPKGPVPPGEVP